MMCIFMFPFIPISVVKEVVSLKKNLLKMTILLSRKRDDPRGFYGTVHVKFIHHIRHHARDTYNYTENIAVL
jgi:hypothetical protein